MQPQSTAEFRSQIEGLIKTGSDARALHLLRERVHADPPLHEYRWLSEQLSRLTPSPILFKLGLLNTFTLEPIKEILRAVGLAQGFDFDLYFGGFQQLEQEVMTAASGLVRHEPRAVVFAWRLEDLAPALWSQVLEPSDEQLDAEVEAALTRIRALAGAARQNLPAAQCLMHGFVRPGYPALGVIDAEHPRGHKRVLDRLNDGLAELARQTDGVHVVDCDAVARRVGPAWFDARHWYTARAPLAPAALAALALEYVKYARALAGKTKKVLVTDLDNTLWGGILGEDGLEGIAIGANYPGNAFVAFQREVKQLARRGIVLAINSKNNEPDVRDAFEKHEGMVLRWSDFAAARVNWQDKATNMRELAEELSLGLDSFVFIDDNPVELEIIQQQLPEVTLVQAPREAADLPGLLSRRGYFDHVIFSEEDRRRGEWYQAQAQRAQFARSSGDIESFYRSLAMRLTVLEVGDAELARVAQLTQRTNQFNMTTRRYSEADIRRFLGSSDHVVRAYRLEDRFGDNGVIGVVIMERAGDVCRLDTFLMSCRVIGRTVETAIVALIAEEARARQAVAVIGEFLPTKKNAPAREVYPKLGFGKVAESETCITWRLDLAGPRLDVPGWFEVLGAPVKS